MLRVQDVPIHALGPPLAVPSPYVGAPGKGQHLRGSRPFQPTKSGPVRIVISSRLRGRGRWRPELGKEAPNLSCSSGGVENGLETCLKENNLERELHINKISHSVVDLPLSLSSPLVNSPCCPQGRAWGTSIAGPTLPIFFTRPTPDRTVVRPFRARPRRRGEIAGEGSRVSPPRYREVIPLPQQTPAESGARPPAIRRSDGVAKTAGPRARSCPAGGHPVHNSPAA